MQYLKLQFFLTFLLLFGSVYSQSWVQQSSGTTLNLNSVCFMSSSTGYIGCDSGRVLKTTNGGINWTQIYTGYSFNIISIKFYGNLGIAAGDKIIKTTNSGLNWFLFYDTAYCTDICFFDSTKYYVSSNFPHSNKYTSNNGSNWINIPSTDFFQMSIFFTGTAAGWLGAKAPAAGGFSSQHLDATTNTGLNWVSQYSGVLLNGNGAIFDILFINSLTGFAVASESTSKIIKTSNAGANWSSTTVTNGQKNIFFLNNQTGWTCGYSGVIMKTLNTGTSWASEQTPVTAVLNSIYFANNETGWTCGANGTILKSTNGGITGLSNSSVNIPAEFSLSQNYPNPFNPITRIRFSISGQSTAQTFLSVYDVLGNEVAVIVDQNLKPGRYEADWDASSYPSGVYFYKLNAGEFSQTKKMILLK